jgi:hypothetical protein
MKTILLILALSGSLSAEVGVSLYTNGITKSASDARYVLRNPYYDGSQSVTVASFTNAGASTLTGKVGIGKAPGSYELDVNGGIYAQYTSVFASNLSVNGSAFSVGTSTLVVKGGKVGVGTAVSATYLLNVGGDINIGVSNGLYSNGRALMYSGATGTFIKSYDSDASDGIHFLSNTGNAERMFIREDGNVGIGTTAPDQKLTVAGNISLTGQVISSGTGSNYFAGTIRHTTTGSYLNNNSVCAAGSGNVPVCMFGGGSNGSISSRLSNFPLQLGTFDNADILTLGIAGSDTGANFKGPVGISSTTPAAQLGVTGGIIATSSITAQGGLYSPTTAINYFAGNVGIGTAAPTSKVSVSSSTASTAFMGLNGAATKAEILAFDPVKAGEMFFCTDCVASTVCISTGTAVADFADIGDRTVACN